MSGKLAKKHQCLHSLSSQKFLPGLGERPSTPRLWCGMVTLNYSQVDQGDFCLGRSWVDSRSLGSGKILLRAKAEVEGWAS